MPLSSLPWKLAWLVSHPEFRRSPLQVTARVVKWELIRLRKRPVELSLGRFRFLARPHDGIGRLICYFGESADEFFAFLPLYVRRGMTFVDVGANIGTHSVYAADLVGSEGQVFSFEPVPETLRILKDNLALNNVTNAIVDDCCLSDGNGISVLHVNLDSAKTSLVRQGSSAIKVTTKTLDTALPAGVRIDILKIDVEGADYAVLRGAAEIFATAPPGLVIIEITQDTNQILSFLRARDYRLFMFDRHARMLRELTVVPTSLFNCYAVHASVDSGSLPWLEASR